MSISRRHSTLFQIRNAKWGIWGKPKSIMCLPNLRAPIKLKNQTKVCAGQEGKEGMELRPQCWFKATQGGREIACLLPAAFDHDLLSRITRTTPPPADRPSPQQAIYALTRSRDPNPKQLRDSHRYGDRLQFGWGGWFMCRQFFRSSGVLPPHGAEEEEGSSTNPSGRK